MQEWEWTRMNAIYEDIAALIRQRITGLDAEKEQLLETMRALPAEGSTPRAATPPTGLQRETAADRSHAAGSLVVMGDTHHMSDAARRKMSRRMKARWRDARAAGKTSLGRRKKH